MKPRKPLSAKRVCEKHETMIAGRENMLVWSRPRDPENVLHGVPIPKLVGCSSLAMSSTEVRNVFIIPS